ncbi:aspartate kinase [Longimonas halophila]|uniref:Aspartate kinase n=1 Tax=Longimonas halophila TaxID=1469170 RepID=A0A2H3P3Y9_9BACT|nr:aspartate kinase [Longimonas halophila]PEN09229.1 aspartate kinase [Longimonas halophila]
MSTASRPVVVMKFGGTATGSVGRMRTIGAVVRQAQASVRPVLVVSALSGVTRRLDRGLQAVVAAREASDTAADGAIDTFLADLKTRHQTQAREVLSEAESASYADTLQQQLKALRIRLNTVVDTGFTPALRDAVLATGEQLSVPMVVATLRDQGLHAQVGDATALIETDATYGEANVHLEPSKARITDWFAGLPDEAVPVVAGFVGADANGTTTTLGFEGSDYTASLLASFLHADSLTRFTDVDGIYTADPNTDAAAQRLDRLTMEQAFAWTESGRLGMHPKTLRPLAERAIPMQVRSIDRPTAPGTQIVPDAAGTSAFWPPLAA